MAYRYSLVPKREDLPRLNAHIGECRLLWNLLVEQAGYYRRAWGSTPGSAERSRQLTELRREVDWLREGSAVIQQQALRDFDRALSDFYSGKTRYPRFKKRSERASFTLRSDIVQVKRFSKKWASVHVPKLGYVRFRLHCPLPRDLGGARIVRESTGKWFIVFHGEQPVFERSATGESIGIDLGIARSITLSNGQAYAKPRESKRREARRKALQRKLARQRKGSRKREITKRKIARLYAFERDRSRDWIEKRSTEIVRAFDVIAIEDLKVVNMLARPKPRPTGDGSFESNGRARKRGLNRSISQQGWARLRSRIEDKAAAATQPVLVIAINPAFTSQTCSHCDHVAKENRESQAIFCCVKCGYSANADVNAARNIHARGLAASQHPAHAPGHGVHARDGSLTRNLRVSRDRSGKQVDRRLERAELATILKHA